MPRIVIVGAGISGLAIAYRLQARLPLADIVVLERDSRPGGKAWTERDQGFQVEIGPNGFLDTKPTTLELCRDLGLVGRLVQATEAAAKNRYLYQGDRLQRLPGGIGEFLRTDLLTWRGKLNFLLERFRGKLSRPTDESIAAFARRRIGRQAADTFTDALVTGIYAGDPNLLSLAACFPRIAELEREYGSIFKGLARTAKERRAAAKAAGRPYHRPGKMWSFPEGLRVLGESLAGALRQVPTFGINTRGVQAAGAGPRWTVCGDGRDAWAADVLVLACPAHQQAQLLDDIDDELADRVGRIPYNRIAVVALGFRRDDIPMSLDGFGFIAPQRLRRDVLGVQWCSSIYPGRAPAGTVLMRAMCGGWHRADVVSWDDDRLLAALRTELRAAMGVSAAPIYHKIVRWDRAIPQYHVGHLDQVAWIGQRLQRHPGLFLAGNAYHGVALNDCVEQGAVVAEQVARFVNVERN